MNTQNTLGETVKRLREKIGLTQAHIAEFTGVDQSLISKIENGERAMSSDMVDKLSALFCYPLLSATSEAQKDESYSFAFRTTGIEASDLFALAEINRIALNQKLMDTIAGGYEQ